MSREHMGRSRGDFQRLMWCLDNDLKLRSYEVSFGGDYGAVTSVLVGVPLRFLGEPQGSKSLDVFQRFPKVFGKMRDAAWRDGLTTVSQYYETSRFAYVEFRVDRTWVGKTIGILRLLSLI